MPSISHQSAPRILVRLVNTALDQIVSYSSREFTYSSSTVSGSKSAASGAGACGGLMTAGLLSVFIVLVGRVFR